MSTRAFVLQGAVGFTFLAVIFAGFSAWAEEIQLLVFTVGFLGLAAAFYFAWATAEISSLRAERGRRVRL